MVNLDQGGSALGHTRLRPPPADLADLIACAFNRHDDAGYRPAGRAWRIVPEPHANIVVVSHDTPRGSAIDVAVVGARSSHWDTDVSRRRFTLGLRLRAGALSSLARERATSFTDRSLSMEDVFGSEGRRVEARLDPSDPEGALRVLFDFVRGRSARVDARADRRVIAATREAASVAEIARALAMPTRTLNARIHDSIGLSPKRLLRILRLHRALETYRPSFGWARLAAATGFADQAHLTREVRSLLGETPTRWLARASHSVEPADSFKTPRAPRG